MKLAYFGTTVCYNAPMRWRDVKKQGRRQPDRQLQQPTVSYAGFWARFLGFITDIFMIGMPVTLLMMMLFGYDSTKSADGLDVIMQNEAAMTHAPDPTASILQVLLSMAAYVIFWRISGQTPGKKMARIKVVDARTFERASWLQLIVRFIGYFISFITLVGFFVGLLRRDKRTLHDLISRTAVIYE
jgi:uncharacterized RDD family membrane protein YckC